MKMILMKKEIEDFLRNHGYVLNDEMWWKEHGHIHIDFFDDEDQLCFYGHPASVIEVTRTYLVVYDTEEWMDESVIGEVFRVQLDKIRGMRLTVKEVVKDE